MGVGSGGEEEKCNDSPIHMLPHIEASSPTPTTTSTGAMRPPPRPRQAQYPLLLGLLLVLHIGHALAFQAPSAAPRSTQQHFAFRSSSSPASSKVTFRPGTAADAPLIRQSMLETRMNPTFLNPSNFLVAEEQGPGNAVKAFGQIRPVAGGGDAVFELASVYVLPDARNQGLGTQLVARLVQEFLSTKSEDTRLVLLALAQTASFYTPHGFQVLPDPTQAGLPPLQVLEFLGGSVVARISRGPGTKLVCMELLRER